MSGLKGNTPRWDDNSEDHLAALYRNGITDPHELAPRFPGRTPRGIAWKLSALGLAADWSTSEAGNAITAAMVPGGRAEAVAMRGVDYRAGVRHS